MFTYDGANAVDVVGPLEVFATTNAHVAATAPSNPPPYTIEIVAARPGPVTMASGIRVVAENAFTKVRRGVDTLIVCGGDPRAVVADPRVLRWLAAMQPRVRRLASVCTGAFILATAGVLTGRRATTHWRYTRQLDQLFPKVRVDPDALFVRDGKVYTSAGVTAGMDLALALVQEDHGQALALEVARSMVLFLKRPGGQSQFSTYLSAQTAASGPLGKVLTHIHDHLGEDLSVATLAKLAAMSPRNFARVFFKETGTTPAKFVERARIEQARRILEDTQLPIETVARECGFRNAERMRRTFQRNLHVVPRDYRKRFESPIRRRDRARRAATNRR